MQVLIHPVSSSDYHFPFFSPNNILHLCTILSKSHQIKYKSECKDFSRFKGELNVLQERMGGRRKSCSPPTVSQIPASVFRVIPYSFSGGEFGWKVGLNGLNVGLPLITAGVPMTIQEGVGESWRERRGSERCRGERQEGRGRLAVSCLSHLVAHSHTLHQL